MVLFQINLNQNPSTIMIYEVDKNNKVKMLNKKNFQNNLSAFSREELIKNCQIISIIDGSIIDLKKRAYDSFHLNEECSRNLQKNYLNCFNSLTINCRNKNPFNLRNTQQTSSFIEYNNFNREFKQISNVGHLDIIINKKPYLLLNKNSNFKYNSKINSNLFIQNNNFNGFNPIKQSAHTDLKGSLNFNEYRFDDKSITYSKGSHDDFNSVSIIKDNNSFIKSISNESSFCFFASNFQQLYFTIKELGSTKANTQRREFVKEKLNDLISKANLQDRSLKRLINFLNKFLLNKKLNHNDILLNDVEVLLFCIFLKKKKYEYLEVFEWNLDDIERLQYQQVKKRSEQKLKIILKPFFKKMIQQFKIDNSIEDINNEEFYKFYFKDAADICNVNWQEIKFEKVFNEKKVNTKNTGRVKTKKCFARVLKKSKIFYLKLKEYLDSETFIGETKFGVMKDNLKITEGKIIKLINKWESIINLNEYEQKDFIKFVISNLENNKVKFPWGYQEIKTSVQSFYKLLRKVL